MNWQSVIEDIVVTNVGGDGILVTNENAAGQPISNTEVNGRIAGSFIEAAGQDGIRVLDSGNSVTDWNLVDNWVAQAGDDAIDLDNAAGWRVIGHHTYRSADAAIHADRLFGSSVSDNYDEDFGGNAAIDLALNCCASSVVTGNRIFDLDGTGSGAHLRLSVVSDRATASAVGNAVRCREGGRRRGVGLDYQAKVTAVSTGNSVVGCKTPRRLGRGASVSRGR